MKDKEDYSTNPFKIMIMIKEACKLTALEPTSEGSLLFLNSSANSASFEVFFWYLCAAVSLTRNGKD